MDRNLSCYSVKSSVIGQARKSLWIETERCSVRIQPSRGQARKSLWIENSAGGVTMYEVEMVRLVRAYGSKHVLQSVRRRHDEVRLVRACGSKLP